MDLGELQTIVRATSERLLSEEEQEKLHASHQLLADLILPELQTNESSAEVLGKTPKTKEKTKKPPKKGHGRRSRDDFKNANVVKVPLAGVQPGQPCDCGCGKLYPWARNAFFRHFVGRAPIEVTIYELGQFKCNTCDKVFTASLPDGVGPEEYDATAVTTIALHKYGLGLPFYRQAGYLQALGVPIAASTQYKVLVDALKKLQPVYDHLLKLAAQGRLAHFDDTSMKIIDLIRPENDERTGVFTTGLVSLFEAFEVSLLFTGRNHAGENRAEFLKNRDPDLPAMLLMSDALHANFKGLDDGEDVIACCLAHGRRNFVKILDSFPDQCRVVIEALGTIYHNDKVSKELEHTPEERLAFHQEKSKPVMGLLRLWLDEQLAGKRAEPNSNLGKAIEYLRNHWARLTLFLRVAGSPLDNNVAERLLKAVVRHRKNSLFYRTARGAKTGDIYMSLIETCKRNDVNPFDYLTAIQKHYQAAKEAPENWLPWNYAQTLARLRGSPPALELAST